MSRWKEILKMRAERNKIETGRIVEDINKTKSCFFKKIKIEISLAWLVKKKGLKYLKLEMKEATLQLIPQKRAFKRTL